MDTQVSAQLQSILLAGEGGRSLLPLEGGGRRTSHDLFVVPHLACEARFASFKSSVGNARCALLERVFYHQIRPTVFEAPEDPPQAQFDALVSAFTRRLSYKVNRLTPVPLRDYPSRTYRGRKLALYTKAAERVEARGPLRSDAYLSTFIKHEKLRVGLKRVVPRVIQPRKPEYNVCVGRYLHQLEHFLYRDIDAVFGAPTVMKGYNAFEQGEIISQAWDSFHAPSALGLDASRFDQHVGCSALRWEHRVYDLYYRCPELRSLLQSQLHNVGFVRCLDGGLRYKVSGGRCSGDMNTAMGNCLIMCALVYGLLQANALVTVNRSKVRLLNNGDDCVLVGEASDVRRIEGQVQKYFATAGFVMKVEPVVYELEGISFCQTQPVHDGVRWRMVRDPRVCLTKDATLLSHKYAIEPYLSTQLSAIGDCGIALTSGLPLMQSYYNAMRRGRKFNPKHLDERFRETGFYRLSRGLLGRVAPVTPEARVSFARAFGIVPDLQEALERYYDALDLSTLGNVLDQEVTRVMVE